MGHGSLDIWEDRVFDHGVQGFEVYFPRCLIMPILRVVSISVTEGLPSLDRGDRVGYKGGIFFRTLP
jgi:hypothetical protein